MIDKKVAIINSVFTLDASPPAIPLQIVNIKGMLNNIENEVFDLDIDFFEYLGRDKIKYDIVQYMLGGFAFSYPTSANVPSNYYPFETMPMAELIIVIMYSMDNSKIIMNVCNRLGIKYEDAQILMNKFVNYLEECKTKLMRFDEILISCNSISSVYFTILLSKKIKDDNKEVKIYSIGKNLLIPEIKEFIDNLQIIDEVLEESSEIDRLYPIEKDNLNKLDFDAIDINKYHTKWGLHSVFISCSEGCPGKCDFCSIRLSWKNNEIRDSFQYYPIECVMNRINQIEKGLGKCFVHIDDCTLNTGSNFSYKLLDKLKETNMLYSCNLRADNLDDEFIRKLRDANFYKVIVGVETVNDKTVKILNKGKDNYVNEVKNAIPKLMKSGIHVQMNILLYHPMESLDDVKTGVERWKEFFQYLKKENLYNYDAPVGTLCLNYPSKMYFKVLNDNKFKIYCHKLPKELELKVNDNIREAFEKIPHYAIRICDNKNDISNKMETVNEIYKLSKNEDFLIDNYVNTLVNNSKVVLESWINNDIMIAKNLKFNSLKSKNRIIELIRECIDDDVIAARELINKINGDKQMIVAVLLVLNKEGFIELENRIC